MKTTTANKPTIRRPQAKLTSTPPTLEIIPFTVTTEWVKITIHLASHEADFFASQNDTVRDGIGGEISNFSFRARRDYEGDGSADGYKHMIEIAGRISKGEPGPVSFSLPLWQWQGVEKTATFLSTTPERIARAAIIKRLSEIREFLRTAAKKGGAS